MSTTATPAEIREREKHLPSAIELQKRIVAAARQRPEVDFMYLVFLCHGVAKKFKFEELTRYELNEVLWLVKDGKEGKSKYEMEWALCECYRMYHAATCPVREFRKAIEP